MQLKKHMSRRGNWYKFTVSSSLRNSINKYLHSSMPQIIPEYTYHNITCKKTKTQKVFIKILIHYLDDFFCLDMQTGRIHKSVFEKDIHNHLGEFQFKGYQQKEKDSAFDDLYIKCQHYVQTKLHVPIAKDELRWSCDPPNSKKKKVEPKKARINKQLLYFLVMQIKEKYGTRKMYPIGSDDPLYIFGLLSSAPNDIIKLIISQ